MALWVAKASELFTKCSEAKKTDAASNFPEENRMTNVPIVLSTIVVDEEEIAPKAKSRLKVENNTVGHFWTVATFDRVKMTGIVLSFFWLLWMLLQVLAMLREIVHLQTKQVQLLQQMLLVGNKNQDDHVYHQGAQCPSDP